MLINLMCIRICKQEANLVQFSYGNLNKEEQDIQLPFDCKQCVCSFFNKEWRG